MLNKLASGKLTVEFEKETREIEKQWVLLVRNDEIRTKLATETPRLKKENYVLWFDTIGHKNCTIISLVDLLKGIDKADFNKAVKKCISSNDYCESWGIKLSDVSGLSSEE